MRQVILTARAAALAIIIILLPTQSVGKGAASAVRNLEADHASYDRASLSYYQSSAYRYQPTNSGLSVQYVVAEAP